MATEAARFLGRPLDNQRQLQNRLDTNRPSHGRTYLRPAVPMDAISDVRAYGQEAGVPQLRTTARGR
jgi:hypothetical protein